MANKTAGKRENSLLCGDITVQDRRHHAGIFSVLSCRAFFRGPQCCIAVFRIRCLFVLQRLRRLVDGVQALIRGTIASAGRVIDGVVTCETLNAILDQGTVFRLHSLKIPVPGGLVLRGGRSGKEQIQRQQQASKPQKFRAANDGHGPVLMRWKH